MKKAILFLAIICFVSLSKVSAQDAAVPKKEVFSWNKKYMTELGITSDIQSQIVAIKKKLRC